MNISTTLDIALGMASRRLCAGRRRWSSRRPTVALVALVGAVLGISGCAAQMPAVQGLPAAASDAIVAPNEAAPFSVGVIPDRAPPVRIGDQLGFMLSASTTGYGHLYLINASGAVLVLAENLVVASGSQTAFPAPGSGFVFRASPPAGLERVLFLMTRQPFKGFGGGANGPVQLPMQADDFIANLNAVTRQLPKQGWALAETRVEIAPAGG